MRKCESCRYWRMGIPIGWCTHQDAMSLYTSDRMVFESSGDECPIVKIGKSAFENLKKMQQVLSDIDDISRYYNTDTDTVIRAMDNCNGDVSLLEEYINNKRSGQSEL